MNGTPRGGHSAPGWLDDANSWITEAGLRSGRGLGGGGAGPFNGGSGLTGFVGGKTTRKWIQSEGDWTQGTGHSSLTPDGATILKTQGKVKSQSISRWGAIYFRLRDLHFGSGAVQRPHGPPLVPLLAGSPWHRAPRGISRGTLGGGGAAGSRPAGGEDGARERRAPPAGPYWAASTNGPKQLFRPPGSARLHQT